MSVFRHVPMDLDPHVTETLAAHIGTPLSYAGTGPCGALEALAMPATGGRTPEILLSNTFAVVRSEASMMPVGLALTALDAPGRLDLLDLVLMLATEGVAETLIWQVRTAIDGHAERAPMTLMLARDAFAAWDPARLDPVSTGHHNLTAPGTRDGREAAGAVITTPAPTAHDQRAMTRAARSCLDIVGAFA